MVDKFKKAKNGQVIKNPHALLIKYCWLRKIPTINGREMIKIKSKFLSAKGILKIFAFKKLYFSSE